MILKIGVFLEIFRKYQCPGNFYTRISNFRNFDFTLFGWHRFLKSYFLLKKFHRNSNLKTTRLRL